MLLARRSSSFTTRPGTLSLPEPLPFLFSPPSQDMSGQFGYPGIPPDHASMDTRDFPASTGFALALLGGSVELDGSARRGSWICSTAAWRRRFKDLKAPIRATRRITRSMASGFIGTRCATRPSAGGEVPRCEVQIREGLGDKRVRSE